MLSTHTHTHTTRDANRCKPSKRCHPNAARIHCIWHNAYVIAPRRHPLQEQRSHAYSFSPNINQQEDLVHRADTFLPEQHQQHTAWYSSAATTATASTRMDIGIPTNTDATTITRKFVTHPLSQSTNVLHSATRAHTSTHPLVTMIRQTNRSPRH